MQKILTDTTKSVYGKYFLFHSPFVIPAKDDVPKTTYTHLYIRKPDITKPQAGDVDFYMKPEKYSTLKISLLAGNSIPGMKILDRPDLDLIELYEDNINAFAYIGKMKAPTVYP